jgi:hypothetical protein
MEKILGYINDIKRSGLSTVEVGYGNWIIIFTDKSIYFVKLGSNLSGPIAVLGGALGGYVVKKASEVLGSKKEINIENDKILEILSSANSYYKFNIDEMERLEIEIHLFLSSINTISFLGKTNNRIKIILTKNQYQKFIEYCNTFYSYDVLKNEKKSSVLKSLSEVINT